MPSDSTNWMQYFFQYGVDGLQPLGKVGVLEAERVLYLGQLSDLGERHHGQEVLMVVVGIHVAILLGLTLDSSRGLAQCRLVLFGHAKLVGPSKYGD